MGFLTIGFRNQRSTLIIFISYPTCYVSTLRNENTFIFTDLSQDNILFSFPNEMVSKISYFWSVKSWR